MISSLHTAHLSVCVLHFSVSMNSISELKLSQTTHSSQNSARKHGPTFSVSLCVSLSHAHTRALRHFRCVCVCSFHVCALLDWKLSVRTERILSLSLLLSLSRPCFLDSTANQGNFGVQLGCFHDMFCRNRRGYIRLREAGHDVQIWQYLGQRETF